MPAAATTDTTATIKRTLPSDVQSLHAMVLEREAMVLERDLLIEKLKLQIARMKRARFGASSEKLDTQILQLELIVEDLESTLSAHQAGVKAATAVDTNSDVNTNAQTNPCDDLAATTDANAPERRALPEHLPRERVVYAPMGALAQAACGCKHCGADEKHLTELGTDESEILEYVPGRFKVLVQVRPKYLCGGCKTISQAEAPHRPLARSYAGASLLAHVLTAKYADHLPLYRQSEIYAREGVELSRSTLADWVGGACQLLDPLVQSLAHYVKGATKLHADDTPVPVLQPGRGTTKTGRLWTYVRDDCSAPTDSQFPEPAAVWFAYSPDRKGEHPALHLKDFKGILQADGYAGFERLYAGGSVVEAACWAHVRRKFFDLHTLQASSVALEALNRIGALYKIESEIRGKPPDERRRIRQLHTQPLMHELKDWFEQTLARVSRKSELAVSIRYALTRWVALNRFVDDGRIEIDNNAAERALRCVALGRKNFLFAGSDAGGERAAAFYSLIGTAKLNGLDPEAYLRYVIAHLNEHRVNKVVELLPWNVAAKLPRLTQNETAPLAIAA
jgi:transposase